MTTYTLKELVTDKGVDFIYYFDEQLWYNVRGTDFNFPVSVEEAKGATFLANDKALLFMRFIRKYLSAIEEAKVLK